MFYNFIITIFSLLIGLGIALLYYFFPAFFTSLVIPLLVLVLVAVFALGCVIYTALKALEYRQYSRIWRIYAIGECGSLLAFSALSTIVMAIVAFIIPLTNVTNLTFIIVLLLGIAIASMLLSLYCFIKRLIRQSNRA